RLRTIFLGLGGGGTAAAAPSDSDGALGSASAAGCCAPSGAAVAGCVPLWPLDFLALGSSTGGGGAAVAVCAFGSGCSCAPLYSSLGTPCSRPGTPLGKTGSRLPGSFFLVSRKSSRSLGSKLLPRLLEQPASTADSATTIEAAIRRCDRRMVDFSFNSVRPSAFRDRRQQGLQRFGARAHAGRRLGVIGDHVEPFARRGHIVGAPGRQRQQFARGVTEGRGRFGLGLEPLQEVGITGRIDQQLGSADPGQFLIERRDAAVGRDVVVEFDGGLRIAARDFAGGAQPRQQAIAGWRGRRQ